MYKKLLVSALVIASMNAANAANDIVPVTGKLCALTQSVHMNDLVNKAGIIFKGQLVSSTEKFDNKSKLRVREMTYKVDSDGAIKGVNGSTITLSEWAGPQTPVSSGQVVPGETYVFFFYSPSKVGLTSLVGFEQGFVGFDNNGVPQLSARVLNESKDVFGEVSTHKGLSILGKSTGSNSPKNYSELKELCQNLMK